MSITLFDKFINALPINVLEGKDISQVIMIDPPEGLPPSLLAGKGVLDTETNTLDIYNDEGSAIAFEYKLTDIDIQNIVDELEAVKTTAENADALSKENAGLLVDALIKDESGWNVENLNIYNVSRLSRTSNAINSSGVSIGDVDVNLHGDTVGITSSNSGTTYAVFNAGGLNLNDYPLIRMGSGGDNDTSAANIGDVKRIATSGSGLKPTDDQWDMLNLPVINVAQSEIASSAATVGQVTAVETKADNNTSEISSVKTTADAADALSKQNEQAIANLPPPPDLSGYVKNGDNVNFGTAEINIVKVTKGDDNTKFSDILIDGNTNTELNFVGDTHFYIRDKADNSKGLEAFQIDSSARFVAKQKVKTPILTNLASGTTNSNSENAAYIDLSESEFVKLGAKQGVKVNVAGNGIVEFIAAGLKYLRDVDANNQNVTSHGAGYQIEGSSTGNLKIRNANGIYKNDSTENNSIHFADDDLKYKAAHHMFFKNANDSQIFGVSDSGANLFNHNVINVKHLLGNEVGSMNVAGIKILKRNDDNDTAQSIQFNTGDLTYFSDKHEFKTNGNARRLTIEDHIADWHDCKLSNIAIAEADKDVPNLKQVQDLIAGSGGGAIEFKKVKSNVTGSPQYFYHQGDNHMFIEYTGNGGTVQIDSMRPNTPEQAEDMVVIHNKTAFDCSIRLFFNGNGTTYTVKPFSYLHGWANREIEQWVVTTMLDPSAIPQPMVVPLSSLAVSPDSDPRETTKRILAAMPNNSICISNHTNNSGTSKYRFISRGDTKNPEVTDSTAIIVKSTDGRATGLSTTKTSSGKSYSRVLDGSRGAWFTNETANSFSLSSDIDVNEYPEGQLFLTGDKGIMLSIFDEDNNNSLQQVTGYNVPKNEADIAALEVQTEKTRSVTHTFINEGELNLPWPDESRRPLVEVQVLNTMQQIDNSFVTVTDSNDGTYSGQYNTVGGIAINSLGNWANVYTYHNAYKHNSENYYVAYNQGASKWEIIVAENPHTNIGSKAAASTIQLGGKSSLPETFGDYAIDPHFDDINSLEFITAEVAVVYDDDNSTVIINFNGARPSGRVVLK